MEPYILKIYTGGKKTSLLLLLGNTHLRMDKVILTQKEKAARSSYEAFAAFTYSLILTNPRTNLVNRLVDRVEQLFEVRFFDAGEGDAQVGLA